MYPQNLDLFFSNCFGIQVNITNKSMNYFIGTSPYFALKIKNLALNLCENCFDNFGNKFSNLYLVCDFRRLGTLTSVHAL